jgi:uncharacterized membrane protein
MKYADIQRIREAGLISEEQQLRINEHFKLKEDANRFLAIVSFFGAILVAAGIVLLIAANWDTIPRGIKLAAGLGLMLGAHAAGWWLREVRKDYRKTGEALYLVGGLLFLGNIALVGQIYHLVSRPPNAFLLWFLGIAPLPWLLRSRALHVLGLLSFGLWFGMEVNEKGSPIYLGDESQVLAYALLGLVYFGLGLLLRRGSFTVFSTVTERLGLLALLLFSYPLTWPGFMWGHHADRALAAPWLLPVLAVVAMALVAIGARHFELDRQWRWTWGLTLVGAAGLLAVVFFVPDQEAWRWYREFTSVNAGAALALFVFSLLQIQVGLQERSPFLVNLGVVFIALDIIAVYFGLFGTMAFTGMMFVVSGVFLMVFGVWLEKKRRRLMRRLRAVASATEVQS